MIGLGTWKFKVDTMFYCGSAVLAITGEGGEYAVTAALPELSGAPDITIGNITEDGNTLSGIAVTNALPGKEIPCSITFEGGTAAGFLKVPFIGKLELQDGQKIA